MEQALINGEKYTIIKEFEDDEVLRKSYNELTKQAFCFDFEQWYQGGYWSKKYMPYSLVKDNKIVASIAANIMDFYILGESKRYIQIGTVMTDKVYRKQGLARYLMNRILKDWQDKCDMIYLFANDSALDFYPKFGFKAAYEYQYCRAVSSGKNSIAVKLDMSLEDNRKFLVNKLNASIPISKLSMRNNPELIMFYCISFMNDQIYYLNDQDIIAVAEFQNEKMYLRDIFSENEINLEDVINVLINEETQQVILGFTPCITEGYAVDLLKGNGTTLFVMNDKPNLLKNNKLMFPELSHA